ncbi:hypothetical protein R3P38DRAFT_2810932 [Favolaschia claudopus]|uniref:Uncharacterized protein n=1 Tax=Favolaschia claudopus TaxID=2862362 RepID=A0AAV9ZA08_9AGAR
MDLENAPPAGPPTVRTCSQSKCKNPVAAGAPKTCQRCRENGKKYTDNLRAKRKAQAAAEDSRKRARTTPSADTEDQSENEEEEEENQNSTKSFRVFADAQEMFSAIRQAFRNGNEIIFHGTYLALEDPLITNKEWVELTARELWNVGGYRFR